MQSNNFNRAINGKQFASNYYCRGYKAVGFGPAFLQRVEVKLL